MNYTIQNGDTLWNIVKQQFGLSNSTEILSKVNEIASNNGIADPGSIFAGTTINLDNSNAGIDTFQKTSEQNISSSNVSITPGSGQELLNQIKNSGGDAPAFLGNFCQSFGMSEQEVADYLVSICNDPNFGAGVLNPSWVYAQLCQESGGRAVVPNSSDPLAEGIAQFRTCAVDQVNQTYGTNYSYEDRNDPRKAVEMMTLLLKHNYNQTGSLEGATAMYYWGTTDAQYRPEGQQYLSHVLSHINQSV